MGSFSTKDQQFAMGPFGVPAASTAGHWGRESFASQRNPQMVSELSEELVFFDRTTEGLCLVTPIPSGRLLAQADLWNIFSFDL